MEVSFPNFIIIISINSMPRNILCFLWLCVYVCMLRIVFVCYVLYVWYVLYMYVCMLCIVCKYACDVTYLLFMSIMNKCNKKKNKKTNKQKNLHWTMSENWIFWLSGSWEIPSPLYKNTCIKQWPSHIVVPSDSRGLWPNKLDFARCQDVFSLNLIWEPKTRLKLVMDSWYQSNVHRQQLCDLVGP
jgi:hypothetical protein